MDYYRNYLKEVFSQDSIGGPTELSTSLATDIINKLEDREIARLMVALIAFKYQIIDGHERGR